MQIFYQPDILTGKMYLDPEESKHCIKVLRKQEGDEIVIVDGSGGLYKAVVENANFRQCSFAIKESHQEEKRNYTIHIGIAPTKNIDRTEWFVEKAMELGIDRISLLSCDHSERVKVNHERLIKKAISAMKQSLKASLPQIQPLQNFSQFLNQTQAAQKFIAYVDAELPLHLKNAASQAGDYLVLIGPEGDFSKKEIALAYEKDFTGVSLGKSRLRTETAGLAACHILNLIND